MRQKLLSTVLAIALGITGAWVPPNKVHSQPAEVQLAQAMRDLNALFNTLGLTPAQGMALVVQGLERAAPTFPYAAQQIMQSVGVQAFINRMMQNPAFVQSVAALVTWMMDTSVIEAGSTAALGHGASYAQNAGSANMVSLIILLGSTWGLMEGHEYTSTFLHELEQETLLHEKQAYTDLLAVLINRVNSGTVALCDGMDFGRAATLLRVNMHKFPTTPYRNVACKGGTVHPQLRANQCKEAASNRDLYTARWTWSSSTSWEVNGTICGTGSFTVFSGGGFQSYGCKSYYTDCAPNDDFKAVILESKENASGAMVYHYKTISDKEGYGTRYLKGQPGY